MKRRFTRRILAVLVAAAPLVAADARMTDADRANAAKWLEQSRKEFLAAVQGLSEEQWKWKPAPDRWSIAEIAEHVVLAEAAQFANVKKAIAGAPNPAWEEQTARKTAMLETVLAGRMGRVQAPEAIVPKEGLSRSQALERFERQRKEIVQFAAESDLPLKQYTMVNAFFGPLNAYQWLLYAPLHTLRHNQQIAEVKASPGYPK
jgi:uncharacterized damage-inducible protein DinB